MTPESPARPIHILLVEDNPADVRLTQEVFREAQAATTLHVVGDGEEALDFLRGRGTHADAPRPDLVLLDLNLPRRDGREVLSEVKADPSLRRIPVIVLTTSRAKADIDTSYDLHANAYLTKPVDIGEFYDTIAALETFWFHAAKLPGG